MAHDLPEKRIAYIKIEGKNINIECCPKKALKPCMPQDEFDIIESCKLCGQFF